ncbi:MAG: hypothetical protein HY472_01720 [Candidatus Sungbacteria bacterium]|nr:hypothetical protein [Candidatus Sungbacteria bacterium]
MDILKKYEESRTGGTPAPQKSSGFQFQTDHSDAGFLTRKIISVAGDKIRDGRQAQVLLLVLSGVSIAGTMVILFDFVASTPPKVDPLPVGAFPTLELRRRGAEKVPPLARHHPILFSEKSPEEIILPEPVEGVHFTKAQWP